MFATAFALVVYSIALIWIGVAYRKGTSSEFHIADRKVGFLKIAASTFTLIGGGEFVTLTALSYGYGYWSLLFFAGVALGFILVGLLSHRARIDAAENDLQSLPDYFYLHFGRFGSVSATMLACLSLVALLLIQFIVGGLMLSTVTQFPVSVCTIGMAIVVTLYVLFGGFRGVLATDVIQAIVMVAVVVVLFVAYGRTPNPATANSVDHVIPSLGEAVPLLLLGFFAVFGGADVWQRLLSAKDDREAGKGMLCNAGAWLVFGLIVVSIALRIQGRHPDADPNEAFFLMLGEDLPGWLGAIMAILLFSALLSTADTELFVLSVMTNKEISRAKKKEISPRATRIALVIIAFAVSVVALFFQQLVDIYFLLLYCMMILGPVALARLLGRGGTRLALLGMAGGVATLLLLLILDKLAGAYQLLIIVPSLLAFAKSAVPTATKGAA